MEVIALGSNLRTNEYKHNAKQSIHLAIRRDWYLWEEERELLDKWYVLRWATQYFKGMIRTGFIPEGYILHDGVIYQVVYREGYQVLVKYTDQVQISFRRIKGTTTGIALVRTANRKHEHK